MVEIFSSNTFAAINFILLQQWKQVTNGMAAKRLSSKQPICDEAVVKAIRSKLRIGQQPEPADLEAAVGLVAEKLPQFVDKLRQRYPSISPDDVVFCILTKLCLHPKEISIALGISQQSVSNRRRKLNRLLFKMPQSTRNFDFNIRHLK